jgi:hypothetical protein
MSRKFRSVLFVAFAALVVAAPIFAQTAKRYVLTFDVTPAGALVSVDGVPIEGSTTGVTAGVHTIRVSRAGYAEYKASIDVREPQVISVRLRQQQLLVRFQVNVVGASIEVDGALLTGDTVLLSPGVHGLRVTAPSWEEHLEVFTVEGSMTVSVQLRRSGPLLSVNVNVKGAEVWIDDVFRGRSPLTLNLPTDLHTLRVSAEGYEDYEARLNFSRAMTVNVQLRKSKTQPGFSLLNIVIPDQFLDEELSETEARGLLRLYIDGKLANTHKDFESIRVPSGKHHVRLVSGGLSVDIGEFVFLPMIAYDIELSLGIRITSARQ